MRLNEINPVLGKVTEVYSIFIKCELKLLIEIQKLASKGMSANDLSKSSMSYEEFINEKVHESIKEHAINSESDKKKIEPHFDDKKLRCDFNESGSESESEIDLTTTGSPKTFVLVNGCIDFSNNNNNNNSNNNIKNNNNDSDNK